jgi:hypothetical protein
MPDSNPLPGPPGGSTSGRGNAPGGDGNILERLLNLGASRPSDGSRGDPKDKPVSCLLDAVHMHSSVGSQAPSFGALHSSLPSLPPPGPLPLPPRQPGMSPLYTSPTGDSYMGRGAVPPTHHRASVPSSGSASSLMGGGGGGAAAGRARGRPRKGDEGRGGGEVLGSVSWRAL